MAASNVERLAEAYRIWDESKGASLEHWLELFADSVDFRSLAEGQELVTFTRYATSRQQVRAYLEGLVAEWEMIFFRVDRFVAQGDDVVAIGATAWRNRRTGKAVETAKVDCWRFDGGKAVAFHEFYDTAKVIEGARLDEGEPEVESPGSQQF